MSRNIPSIDCNRCEEDGGGKLVKKHTSTQALHVIPSIRSSHVSDRPLVSGSSSACGSSTEPPAEDLLSKFEKMLDSIIASSNIFRSEVGWD